MAGAGAIGTFGLPRLAAPVRGAIPGVTVEYRRCKVAFVSNASAVDRVAVYYADRDGERRARYGIAPTTTNPRGYRPLVVEYDADEDRTQIQVAEARATLVHVVVEGDAGRVAVTNPNAVCVPSGFNTAPTASFTARTGDTAPTSGEITVDVGETVTFTSTATDPDDPERLRYEWDLDGNGTFETAGTTATRTYSAPGTVTVGHRVTDDFDERDTATLVVTVTAPTTEFVQRSLLLAPTPEEREFFGRSVAVASDLLAVGAPNNAGRGTVYVYDLSDPAAVPVVLAPAGSGEFFGGDLDADGTTLAVGAVEARATYVYDLTDLAAAPVRLPFGGSVAVDGDTLVAGDTGAQRVAVYDLTDLSAAPTFLRPDGLGSFDRFGDSLAVADGELFVGAPNGERVYVYDLEDLSAPSAVLAPSGLVGGGSVNANFGKSVAASSDRLAVGAWFQDSFAGGAYVYDRANLGAAPTELNPTGDTRLGLFGRSVAISEGTVIVGAPGAFFGSSRLGGVYVFDLGDLSAPVQKFTGRPERIGGRLPIIGSFGTDVVLSDGTLVAGADTTFYPDVRLVGTVHVFD
jgi:PKD repeat protein